jgi:hypothetical protein
MGIREFEMLERQREVRLRGQAVELERRGRGPGQARRKRVFI